MGVLVFQSCGMLGLLHWEIVFVQLRKCTLFPSASAKTAWGNENEPRIHRPNPNSGRKLKPSCFAPHSTITSQCRDALSPSCSLPSYLITSLSAHRHLIMVLQAIKYTRGQLSVLDQLQLPHADHYDEIHDSSDGWHAIKTMRVRGAPAIAIVAALSLAVELYGLQEARKLSSVAEEMSVFIQEKLKYLVTSRPTAVNLADAAAKLERHVEVRAKEQEATGEGVVEAYQDAAEKMLIDDVRDNRNIGDFGARWIAERVATKEVGILTHCNTGSAYHFLSEMIQQADPDGTDRLLLQGMVPPLASSDLCMHCPRCGEHIVPKHGRTTKARD